MYNFLMYFLSNIFYYIYIWNDTEATFCLEKMWYKFCHLIYILLNISIIQFETIEKLYFVWEKCDGSFSYLKISGKISKL